MAHDVQKLKLEIITAIESLSPESLKLLSEFVDFLRFKRFQSPKEQTPSAPESDNAWTLLETLSGTVQAPQDWAAEHDHYLYGTPKHSVE